MRISDWSSDVCSSDLEEQDEHRGEAAVPLPPGAPHRPTPQRAGRQRKESEAGTDRRGGAGRQIRQRMAPDQGNGAGHGDGHVDEEGRSEEHTSELQSLMRISYAVFCLKKKKIKMTCL